MNQIPFIKSLLLLPALALSTQAFAQLKPMDDSALESTVGQAYIEMDSYINANNSDQVNRITFGQTIKLQANIDSIELGNVAGNVDIAAEHVSFGYIDASNNIVPFVFSDPYFEWSTKTAVDGSQDLTGFRMGFGEAQGILQMDLTSFSGNIGMLIDGQTSALFTGNGTSATDKQGTYIGTSGALTCTEGSDCVSLANIKSLDVGDGSGNPTSDFFLSFQTQNSSWLLGGGTSSYQATTRGFFMNIPTNNSISITDNATGTNGYTVEFIDRGIGRWHN